MKHILAFRAQFPGRVQGGALAVSGSRCRPSSSPALKREPGAEGSPEYRNPNILGCFLRPWLQYLPCLHTNPGIHSKRRPARASNACTHAWRHRPFALKLDLKSRPGARVFGSVRFRLRGCLANCPRRASQIVLAKQISGERLRLRVLLNMRRKQLGFRA